MGWLSDLWRYGFTAEQQRLSRASERYSRAIAAFEQELQDLSPEEAQHQAARLLESPINIRVHPWTSPIAADLASFAAFQRSVFTKVRRIEALDGEPYVDASELRPYQWDPSLRSIGLDSEHTFIVVRAGEETVYVVDETEALDLGEAQSFRTLYHWVLWLDRSGELLSEPY